MTSALRPTDGPNAGRPLRLEPWQHQLVTAIETERRPLAAIRAASQVGKTLLCTGVALHRAIVGRAGCIFASATGDMIRDLSRRLDATIESCDAVGRHFAGPRSGPGARASWRLRTADTGGWLALAAAGSASQLASRTVGVAVADEISRWPARVRSGEGQPLQLLRMRLADWGDDGRLLAISSPVTPTDAICAMHLDGDRRELRYLCPDCGARFPFTWSNVTGRERDETPTIACSECGVLHDESARRRMLRGALWTATRPEPVDEDVMSFTLSRLDSARSSLSQVVREWRRARRAQERGDPLALAAFRNTVLGQPAESGAADVDQLLDSRERTFDLTGLEQVVGGADVQSDRLVFVVLGFAAGNTDAWVLAHGEIIGDPRDNGVWQGLDGALAQPFGGLPVSVVGIDAGYLTDTVRRQCGQRRWWVATVGRAGQGIPLARGMSAKSGLATMGKDDANAWWSGRCATGHVHLPLDIGRRHVAELCAAEALTSDRGALKWKPIAGRQNHRWDAATLCVFGRHYRRLTGARRPFRLVAV